MKPNYFSQSQKTPEILIVEDEIEIRELMALHLLRQGFRVTEVGSIEDATEKIKSQDFDLLVLDWMLPHGSGIDLVSSLRSGSILNLNPAKIEGNKVVPILMVTAMANSEDVVRGLDVGADDYVTKPFEPKILIARVNALLRRKFETVTVAEKTKSNVSADELVKVGNLEINLAAHEVFCGPEKLHLTPSEFTILTVMAQNQGRVMTRERLIEEVQGEGISVVGRTIDTHVFGLRKKLGTGADFIETIRGVGYRVKTSASEGLDQH
jgi:two-component system phosphate regulon response regulator PhoB